MLSFKEQYKLLKESKEIYSKVKEYIDNNDKPVEITYDWGENKGIKSIVAKKGDTYYAVEPKLEKDKEKDITKAKNDGSKSTSRSSTDFEKILNKKANFRKWKVTDEMYLPEGFLKDKVGPWAVAGALALGVGAKSVDAKDIGGDNKTDNVKKSELVSGGDGVKVLGADNVGSDAPKGLQQLLKLLDNTGDKDIIVSVGKGTSTSEQIAYDMSKDNARGKLGTGEVNNSSPLKIFETRDGKKTTFYTVMVFKKSPKGHVGVSDNYQDLADQVSNSSGDHGENEQESSEKGGGIFSGLGKKMGDGVKALKGVLAPLPNQAPPKYYVNQDGIKLGYTPKKEDVDSGKYKAVY